MACLTVITAALTTLYAGYIIHRRQLNSKQDGRSSRASCSWCFSIRSSQFKQADANPVFDNGWFLETLRCTKASFNKIVDIIEQQWKAVHYRFPGHNAVFSLQERVGVCLHYITHADSLADSAKVFGMGRSSAWRYIEEVIDVLVYRVGHMFIHLVY